MQGHTGAPFNNITHGSAAGDSVHSGSAPWSNVPRSRDVGGGVRDIGFAARMAGGVLFARVRVWQIRCVRNPVDMEKNGVRLPRP